MTPLWCSIFIIGACAITFVASTVPTLTRFNVCDVEPRNVSDRKLHKMAPGEQNWTKPYHLAQDLKLFQQARCTEIIQGTTFNVRNTYASANGFVYSVTEAYNRHHHLILRPDDIWMAIMTQFSFYINARAEEFRGKFVNFQGKKELTVRGIGTLRTASYDRLVMAMEAQIHDNLVDDTVRGWIMPNFTTTTENDRVTSGVVFMASMKKYFSYKFSLSCGIPTVSLDGTVQDWQEIRTRLNKLDTYGLTEWANMLKPILDQFVSAKSGQADKGFWSRVAHYTGGGSGPTYLSGWITTFCYFDKDGRKQGVMDPGKEWPRIDTNDIPSGVVEVDVKIDDNGVEYNTTMLAGSMAQEIGSDGMTLQPRSGWIIALKDERATATASNDPFARKRKRALVG